MQFQLLVLSQVILAGLLSAATDKIVCYYGTWSVYRPGNGKFDVEDIDPFLCTHIVYAFVGITSDAKINFLDPWNDIDKKALERFNGLKRINPELKTLLAVGGWNEGSDVFSDVAADTHLRSAFIKDSIRVLQEYGFDGLDIDWEYPARRGGQEYDKDNFSLWLKEFRKAFDKHGLLVTAAVSATSSTVDESYDVPELVKYLDFISVMTYDFHGDWEYHTGQNSPLHASSIDISPGEKELNIDACIKSWISKGAPADKLILGMGTYGRSFTLRNSNEHGLGAPISGPGKAGPYTRQAGILGYNEIVEGIKNNQWNFVWDDEQKVPYGYKNNQWIGYDNLKSFKLKVEYALKYGLGGTMIWSLETDDFRGLSGTKNPLIHTIRSTLNMPDPPSPPPGTTVKPPSTFKCTKSGYFRDPEDCTKFYYCRKHNGGFLQYPYQCPEGLVFNEKTRTCDYEHNAPC